MNRRAAVLVLPTLLVSGCFAGGGGSSTAEDADRIRLALNFPPVAALSPWTDDALLLTRMGAAETLVVFDASGAAQPQLAESWEFTDDRTAVLELRDDVVFHDGTPMDAEAVAGSLTAAAAADPGLRVLRDVGLTATAVDEDTVQVQAAQADPLLVQRLGAPALVVLSPEAYTGAVPDPVGHGTGPYAITEVQGAQSATLDAAADYWGGSPAADGVDVRFVDDADARTSSLRAGELDVAQAVPIAQLASLSDDQRVVTTSLPRVTALSLNTASGVFADPALRAAAVAAIDAGPVVDGVFEGQADAAPGLLTDDTLGAAVRTDPVLPTAGDPAGAAVRLATYDDRPELPEAAAVLAEQLRAAGFTVEVVVQTYATLEPDLLAGAFDAVLGSRLTLLDTGDPVGFFGTDYTCDGGYNLARLCDPAVDAAVAAAGALTDPRQRRQAAADLEAAVLSTGAVVPVLHEQSRTGVASSVQGVGDDPFERQLVTVATTTGR